MNRFTRLAALLVSAIMILGVLASCAKDTSNLPSDSESNDVQNTGDVGGIETSGWETDEKGFVKDSHDGVDLNNRTVRIMCGNSFEKEGKVAGSVEFHVDATDTGTPVKSAIFVRNITVGKRLNCNLKWVDVACEYDTRGDFTAKAIELSGSNEVDLVGVYSLSASSMMMNGLLADLNKSEKLELEKPWWNKEMIDSCTIMNKMYFCSGDIAYGVLGGSYVFMTNKKLMEDGGVNKYIKDNYGYNSIYELVNNNKWTIDVMATLAKLVPQDKNKNSTKDDGDIFGYVSYAVGTDAFYSGSGLKLLETAADGSIIISEDMGSSKAEALCTKITTFLSTNTAVCHDTAGQGARPGLTEGAWNNGQALFFNHFMRYLNEDTSFEKGVIPIPMYDEDQANIGYLTTCTFGAAMWGVFRNAEEYEDLCTVLDVLASESYRQVTPKYFDTVLAGRQNTKDDYDMLYKIREGIVIDGGRVITDPFDEETISLWRLAMRGEKNYLTLYEENRVEFAQEAGALNTLMENIEDVYG